MKKNKWKTSIIWLAASAALITVALVFSGQWRKDNKDATATNAPTVVIPTNPPEPIITVVESNQRVQQAFQNGFAAGVQMAEQARLNEQMPALVQRAYQAAQQGRK